MTPTPTEAAVAQMVERLRVYALIQRRRRLPENGKLADEAADMLLALRNPEADAGGGEFVLVPKQMHVDADAWEAASFAFGGPATGEGEAYMDCTLWVGEIDLDDGGKLHGLHVSCDECPEEGCITLAKFPPAPQPTTPPAVEGVSKPAECATGCPPMQVCDYCQNQPVWQAEWAGSAPGRGWYIREGVRLTHKPVVAYLGDNIDSERVQEVIDAHNATVTRDATPPGEAVSGGIGASVPGDNVLPLLRELRELLSSTKELQGREHIHLGIRLNDAIEALAKREGSPAVEVTDADIDAMRDVYMSTKQREAYDRILTAARKGG